jgi:hypothetical protein
MDAANIFVWQGIYHQTLEYLSVQENSGWTLESTITGVAGGQPVNTRYQIVLDNAWQVQQVGIQKINGPSFYLRRLENGWVNKEGVELSNLKECIDVDISFTPCTNTLPIRRLRLTEGASAPIDVVYFDLENWEVRPMKQQYTNKGHGIYQYKNLSGSDFTSEIAVDESGFVIDYPEIWRRIYPI